LVPSIRYHVPSRTTTAIAVISASADATEKVVTIIQKLFSSAGFDTGAGFSLFTFIHTSRFRRAGNGEPQHYRKPDANPCTARRFPVSARRLVIFEKRGIPFITPHLSPQSTHASPLWLLMKKYYLHLKNVHWYIC
jgi:hypothetical protein